MKCEGEEYIPVEVSEQHRGRVDRKKSVLTSGNCERKTFILFFIFVFFFFFSKNLPISALAVFPGSVSLGCFFGDLISPGFRGYNVSTQDMAAIVRYAESARTCERCIRLYVSLARGFEFNYKRFP